MQQLKFKLLGEDTECGRCMEWWVCWWLPRFCYSCSSGKRTLVAKELLETEKDYIQYLSALASVLIQQMLLHCLIDASIQVYYQPLREKAESETPLLTMEEVRTIFPQIEVLLLYNTKLYALLEERIRYVFQLQLSVPYNYIQTEMECGTDGRRHFSRALWLFTSMFIYYCILKLTNSWTASIYTLHLPLPPHHPTNQTDIKTNKSTYVLPEKQKCTRMRRIRPASIGQYAIPKNSGIRFLSSFF